MSSTMSRYVPGAAAAWQALHVYFQVNGTFVARKLQAVMIPFTKKRWDREPGTTAGGDDDTVQPVPPRSDENAIDLYIPTMAVITWVLLYGLGSAISSGRFTPDILVQSTSRAVVLLILEVLAMRIGASAVAGVSLPVLDSLAVAAYTFTYACVVLLGYVTLGSLIWWALFAYTAAASFVFTTNTLRAGVPSVSAAGQSRQSHFLLVASALQPVALFWLCSV